ncbi:MAG: TauD/TfdA family dioxygenase [Gammaproteobacteria bacterium]|nr:TauD/TfdA family dioxygenase [Gammaproteobacteria bacterium]
MQASPFLPGNDQAYLRWRETKLNAYPESVDNLRVEIQHPSRLSGDETSKLLACCQKTNMVVYATDPSVCGEEKDIPRALGAHFGMTRLDPNLLADDDGITSLQVVPGKLQRGYIPYSDRRLLWHTDGYYNNGDMQIRGMLLHCVRPATRGGENALLDPEIAFILLRDREPRYIEALMAEDAMTIPANSETDVVERPAQSGPVFSVSAVDGSLHMRYTARTRSIEWNPSSLTQEAVAALAELLDSHSTYIFRHKLKAGEGLLCNNVLHNRTAFETGEADTRLLYRARYYDRIAHTGIEDIIGVMEP